MRTRLRFSMASAWARTTGRATAAGWATTKAGTEGYDGGFDDGFYAGIDYHLYGDFVEPTYAFQYARRSDAFAAQTLLALHAPEPTSLMLVGLAVRVCGWSSSQATRLSLCLFGCV